MHDRLPVSAVSATHLRTALPADAAAVSRPQQALVWNVYAHAELTVSTTKLLLLLLTPTSARVKKVHIGFLRCMLLLLCAHSLCAGA